jgi:hypothetical protein
LGAAIGELDTVLGTTDMKPVQTSVEVSRHIGDSSANNTRGEKALEIASRSADISAELRSKLKG